jgi:hypothetical protein
MSVVDLIPPSGLLLIGCVWFYTAILNGKLFRQFVRKFPSEAERSIPFASTYAQHPEKFLYFFRKASIPTLRKDREIWRLRQRLKWFTLASLLIPLVVMGVLILCAYEKL